jgi:hypothetical protein
MHRSFKYSHLIKSRRMSWAGHVAHVGEMRKAYNVWSENLKRRDHLGHIDVYEKIILRCIFREQGVAIWTD